MGGSVTVSRKHPLEGTEGGSQEVRPATLASLHSHSTAAPDKGTPPPPTPPCFEAAYRNCSHIGVDRNVSPWRAGGGAPLSGFNADRDSTQRNVHEQQALTGDDMTGSDVTEAGRTGW